MNETERMNQTIAAKSSDVFAVMAGARRVCKREYQRSPNWVLAMELFGLGNTYAHEICRRNGIDPDARQVFRSTLTHTKGKDNHD